MTSPTTVRRVFTDRSRGEAYERCPRRRYLEYHQNDVGIRPAKENIYLGVGGALHEGHAVLLRAMIGDNIPQRQEAWDILEEAAVRAGLDDLKKSGALELDTTELVAMTATIDAAQMKADMIAQAQELGLSAEGLGMDREQALSQFEQYLFEEQSALVEGMIRAYVRYRLRPLLDEFEVLEVEREGEWLLYESPERWPSGTKVPLNERMEMWFMSRPDALLRERQTNALHLLSYKSTGTWGDIRRLKNAEHDVQGLTEGVEVEQRLAIWWNTLRCAGDPPLPNYPEPMKRFLLSIPEPPRIHAIRYEYLLRGERREDKDLSTQLGLTVRTQRSLLIQQYVARSTPKKGESGYAVGDVCWSWEFFRPQDDKDSKLAWQNWHQQPVYLAPGFLKHWIDMLAASEIMMSGEDSTIGMEPRQLGWRSDAQALGITRKHPFEEVFPPPITIVRNDDELRDVFEQLEAREIRVANDVAYIHSLGKEQLIEAGGMRSILNQRFPQHRSSCFYPTECWATKICYATSPQLKGDPLREGEGKFKLRVPNHPQELKK